MRAYLRMGVLVTTVILWAAGMSEAQDGLTKRSSQGPVTVAVTLMTPPAAGDPVKAKVVLDTHSVALDGIKFEEVVLFRTSSGSDISPTSVEQKGSGHHREAVVVFPPASGQTVNIVVKNIGGVAERIFSWELPAGR